MPRSNCQCPVRIFRHSWRGCWSSDYHQSILAEILYSNAAPKVFSPANVIFSGIGVLLLVGHLSYHLTAHIDLYILQAAKDVNTSQDTLLDLFSRIEYFFRRLEIYTNVPPTAAMTDIGVDIMVEVLAIIGMMTKEVKRGRTSE